MTLLKITNFGLVYYIRPEKIKYIRECGPDESLAGAPKAARSFIQCEGEYHYAEETAESIAQALAEVKL